MLKDPNQLGEDQAAGVEPSEPFHWNRHVQNTLLSRSLLELCGRFDSSDGVHDFRLPLGRIVGQSAPIAKLRKKLYPWSMKCDWRNGDPLHWGQLWMTTDYHFDHERIAVVRI